MRHIKLFTKNVIEVIREDLIPGKRDLVLYKNNILRLVRRLFNSDEVYFGFILDKKIFKFVLTPLTLALLVFTFVRPSLASLLGREERLSQYLASGEKVEV